MILPVQTPLSRKRWVFKLNDLNLDPLKFSDEESRDYDKESGRVGNLVAPNIVLSEEVAGFDFRKYSLFDNYVQVFQYSQQIRSKGEFPHLYEICPYFTKIHFDLDINRSETDLEGEFEKLELNKHEIIIGPYLRTIEKIFIKLFPLNYDPETFARNILVFEAHRPNKKISFHIVLDGYYLSCHESWLVCKEVVDSLFEEGLIQQSEFADFSVYKKNQAFRIFGSNKGSMKGGMGIKEKYSGPDIQLLSGNVFNGTTMVESSFGKEPLDKKLINLRVMERSLISNTLGNIRLTLNRTKVSETNQQMVLRKSDKMVREITLQDEHIVKIMKVFEQSPLSKNERGESVFAFEKLAPGDVVCIRRLRESFCSICKRTHKNENCWLGISYSREVYLYCRRAQDSPNQDCKRVQVGTCEF